MNTSGKVGPITTTSSLSAGTYQDIRLGNMGEQIMSQLHGDYYETCYRRNVFTAANTAAVASVVPTATAYTGLALSNPVGSAVNLVVINASWGASAAISAAGALCLTAGYNSGTNVTHTTPVTPASNFIGVGASGIGLADSAATLPTAPSARMFLTNNGTLATTGYQVNGANSLDLNGMFILPPGSYLAFATTAANTAAWWFSFSWEEVPV